MTILAVDDEPMICALLATVLEQNGFTVLTADCAARAVAIFREHSEVVDLLITDVVLPGMDGPTLAALLQTKRPGLKVLLMSGYCQPDRLINGYEFLPKPFSLSQMIAKVRSLLRTQQAASAAEGTTRPFGLTESAYSTHRVLRFQPRTRFR